MKAFSLCITIDPSLGRVDKKSVYQQVQMEIFTEGIVNKDRIHASFPNPRNIGEWYGVKLRDATKEVTEIDWSYHDLEGTLSFMWLPSGVRSLNLYWNSIKGSFDTSFLESHNTRV